MDSIQVPVEPHVLKYLKFHQEDEHYFLSENDVFGLFLFRLLREAPVERRRDQQVAEYEATWQVYLGSYGSAKWGVAPPTSKAVHLFNSFVHKFILIALHGHVEQALEHGEQAKFAIEHFMMRYGWGEEDIQFATLQKSWTRYWATRKATKKRRASLTGRLPLKHLEKRLLNLGKAA